jgi:hypothetical protein
MFSATKVVFFAGLASTYVAAFQQSASADACTPFEACSCTSHYVLETVSDLGDLTDRSVWLFLVHSQTATQVLMPTISQSP